MGLGRAGGLRRRSGRRARWLLAAAALLGIGAGGLAGFSSADHPPAPFRPMQVTDAASLPTLPPDTPCEELIRQVPAYWPGDPWRIECRASMPAGYEGAGGLTYFDTRRIVIRAGMSVEATRHAVAHEAAHAEAGGFSEATRRLLIDAVGAQTWQTQEYFHSPEEAYAESRSRCVGWHRDDWGYAVIPCETIEAALALEADQG